LHESWTSANTAFMAVWALRKDNDRDCARNRRQTDANPDPVRRDFAAQAIAKATQFVSTNDPIKARAQTFIAAGIKALDALHLASAVEAQVDYFCTCDDRFLKKACSLTAAPTKVVSPLELVAELQP
jgi:predicted nucleic acid-binding protein